MSIHAIQQRFLFALCLCSTTLPLAAQTRVQGRVVDEAGAPVPGALVVYEAPGPAAGPNAWTVFSQADGSFSFPEALLLGTPPRLWVADVSANRIVSIDIASGAQADYEVPSEVLMSPHSLHRDREGALWVTPLFNGIVARLQPDSGA